ncbi:MAG: alkaline phosphatase family protein [Candidatus Koribacter versatilis]|uniref:Alkaline phosphatase family protein n=1 Tax=Candidatus Korobacter versatilis TaxID=658062 RepID=A0A932A6X7_9BACT|nr:alkaline phosphatase family protein [Candidatus Koribacter versatilis]
MRASASRLLLFTVFLFLFAAISLGCRGLQAGGNEVGGGNGGGGTLGATVSPVKRVIVVVMQNRSFDHLFGKYTPTAGQTINGIRAGVPGFTQSDGTQPFQQTATSFGDLPHDRNDYLASWNQGAMNKFSVTEGRNSMGYFTSSTPGISQLWSLADNYALADNYFASVMSNAPSNELYLVSASDNNFPFSVQPFYGPCNQPDPAAQAYTFQNVGDQLNSNNISWGWFQENYGDCGNGYVAVQNAFQFFTSTQGSAHLQDLSAFSSALNAGTLPAVSFVMPSDAHGTHPSAGSISVGLTWLDDFVSQAKASPNWGSLAIVVIWDESGGFWDHVPPPQIDSQGLGMRVPMLAISPFAKPGFVSHTRMDHVSVLKFIQWNWSLGSLNAREDQSQDIREMFQF